jgi:hypothetical protein
VAKENGMLRTANVLDSVHLIWTVAAAKEDAYAMVSVGYRVCE